MWHNVLFALLIETIRLSIKSIIVMVQLRNAHLPEGRWVSYFCFVLMSGLNHFGTVHPQVLQFDASIFEHPRWFLPSWRRNTAENLKTGYRDTSSGFQGLIMVLSIEAIGYYFFDSSLCKSVWGIRMEPVTWPQQKKTDFFCLVHLRHLNLRSSSLDWGRKVHKILTRKRIEWCQV